MREVIGEGVDLLEEGVVVGDEVLEVDHLLLTVRDRPVHALRGFLGFLKWEEARERPHRALRDTVCHGLARFFCGAA